MNYYDFSGGIITQKSPYLMKTNELLDLCNLEVEGGGLTVRAGTKKKYGPFLGQVQAIHKSLTESGHELLFVQTKERVEMVISGVKCNLSFYGTRFQVIPMTTGYLYLIGYQPHRIKNLYCRSDKTLTIKNGDYLYLFLEQLEDDYTTDGTFPEDLYGKNLIDSQTGDLYYVKNHTQATKENISDLLNTEGFQKLGTIGDVLVLTLTEGISTSFDAFHVLSTGIQVTVEVLSELSVIFEGVLPLNGVANDAFLCPYIVWHPASMRYFAAGNPHNPTALYISEPNDISTFLEYNVLYPHLHLGKITGLNVVERSVVVSYEYGWAHYVGSDPTDDGQWSLLSIPDGTKYGDTISLTPGSVSFLSESGLVSFSSSMLTVQMLYSPSSSLYKFLSKDKIALPKPKKQAFSYYKNGNYYLVIDSSFYIYNFFLSSFVLYEGIRCSCLTEDFNGNLLMGCGDCITTFSKESACDYQPDTGTDLPISYRMTAPLLGAVNEDEIARCEEVVVKSLGMPVSQDCYLKLSSEKESREGKLLHTNNLLYGNTDWNYRYHGSEFSETVFPWRVSGNLFLLELFGHTNPKATSPMKILNIYLKMKKERNKL